MREAGRIVGLCVATSVCDGILHDMVTTRVCVEYFTIGHPPIFTTDSPTLLAPGWGVIATWWVGVILGVVVAAAARAGRRPKLSAEELIRPVIGLAVACAVLALLASVAGHVLAAGGHIGLFPPFSEVVPADRHVPFLTALWAHSASYLGGFIGGIILAVRTWRRRGEAHSRRDRTEETQHV